VKRRELGGSSALKKKSNLHFHIQMIRLFFILRFKYIYLNVEYLLVALARSPLDGQTDKRISVSL